MLDQIHRKWDNVEEVKAALLFLEVFYDCKQLQSSMRRNFGTASPEEMSDEQVVFTLP